jgi:translation initiation factor 2 subunit 2
MTYESLLKQAREKMPKAVHEKERFEIPSIRGHLEGNKTIISNFHQIASTLRRPVEHLLKYLLRELATPGEIKRNRLVIGAKVSAGRINAKIKKYADEFVFCSECGKPDTDIKEESNFHFLVCSVCGAKHIVRSKI